MTDARSWSEPSGGGQTLAFSAIQKTKRAGTWVDDRQELVACRAEGHGGSIEPRRVRRFAVLSDHLAGAFGPPSGGMVLFGRNRHVPLSELPPLRFESLEMLAAAQGKELAQSYERSYAGKILTETNYGWDWAPVYLSPELEDTELGMLLNVADQQLKSWSEHGDIRYAGFAYPA